MGNQFPDQVAIPVALAGRVPVKISSLSKPVAIGDPMAVSVEPGKTAKATKAGFIVGRALESWTPDSSRPEVLVYVNPIWYDPGLTLSDAGDLNIEIAPNPKTVDAKYQVADSSGNIIDKIAALANLIVGNIKAGAISANELSSDSLITLEGTVNNLLAKVGIESPYVKTETISPIAQSNLVVNLENTQPGGTTSYGKLSVMGEAGAEVASIDAEGNAKFAGDATVSGELRVNKIYADEIVSRAGNFANLSANTISGITREEIEKMLTEAQIDQSLLSSSHDWKIDTGGGSANLKDVTTENLYVVDQAAINSLSITSAITLGGDLVIQSITESYGSAVNSIDTLASPLRIQSLALAPVEFMAGKVRIDTNGSVTIEGDLFVQGKVESSSLSSGSGQFSDVSTNKVAVTTDSPTGSFDAAGNYIIESVASVGKGKVPAGISEVTIKNINTKANVLIYVTPTTSTGNNVLYVKSQNGCEEATDACEPSFIVGFDREVSQDVEFNWWIVGTQQASSQ